MNRVLKRTIQIGGAAVIAAFLVSLWPNYSSAIRYDRVELENPAMASGSIGAVLIQAHWYHEVDEGLIEEDTVCADGKHLEIAYYKIDLTLLRSGIMDVDKFDGGTQNHAPRPFKFKCQIAGKFVTSAAITFKRHTWYGLKYVTEMQDAYMIRGEILP